MFKNMFERYRKYSVRKYKVGVFSVAVSSGIFILLGGNTALANEVDETSKATLLESSSISDNEKEYSKKDVELKNNKKEEDSVTKETNETTLDKEKIEIKENLVSKKEETTVNSAELNNTESNVDKTPRETTDKKDSTSNVFFRTANYEARSSNSSEINSLINELKSIEYTDSNIANKLASGSVSNKDITNKKLEIMRRTGRKFLEIKDEEAEAEIRKDLAQKYDLEDSFKKVKAELEAIIPKFVKENEVASIKNDKYNFLISLSYLDRLYNVPIASSSLRDLILTDNTFATGNKTATDMLLDLGKSNVDDLVFNENIKVYNKFIRPRTNIASVKDLLVKSAERENRTDIAEWFKEKSSAIITETPSSVDKPYKLFDKLSSTESSSKYLLPLLTVPENTIYVMSNPKSITFGMLDSYIDGKLDKNSAKYIAEKEKFEADLKYASKQQAEFVKFWERVGKEESKDGLYNNVYVVDTLAIKDPSVITAAERWREKTGTKSNEAMRSFFGPLSLWVQYFHSNGVAEGDNSIRLYLSKALDDGGLGTYSHELTHQLERTVWFNNHGRRDGLEVEFYARGLFETYENNDPVLNLNLIVDRENNADRYTNGNPNRFQTEGDLKEYMSGVFDTIYLLDALEAKDVLTRDVSIKAKWFNKMSQENDIDSKPRANDDYTKGYIHTEDMFSKISLEEAGRLNSLEDLVDNNIVASRYEFKGRSTTGLAKSNDYLILPLFSSNYAAMQNSNGVTGDINSRRMAHELLAEYGYFDGMVPYISNQYKDVAPDGKLTDDVIVPKILKGQYANLKEFKKAMLNKRLEKEIKPVTIILDGTAINIQNKKELEILIKSAITADLATPVSTITGGFSSKFPIETNIEKLKSAFYKAVLNNTNEFRSSIFKDNSYDVTVKYVYDNKVAGQSTITVDEGHNVELPKLPPELKDGEYKVSPKFDRAQLNNIRENKEITVPLVKVIPARTLTPATKNEYTVTIKYVYKTEELSKTNKKVEAGSKIELPELPKSDLGEYKVSADFDKSVLENITSNKEITVPLVKVIPAMTLTPANKIYKVKLKYRYSATIIKEVEVTVKAGEKVKLEVPRDSEGEYKILKGFDEKLLENINSNVDLEIPLTKVLSSGLEKPEAIVTYIPYETEIIQDSSLEIGKKVVIIKGKVGHKITTIENGKEILLYIENPIKEVIKVGTKLIQDNNISKEYPKEILGEEIIEKDNTTSSNIEKENISVKEENSAHNNIKKLPNTGESNTNHLGISLLFLMFMIRKLHTQKIKNK